MYSSHQLQSNGPWPLNTQIHHHECNRVLATWTFVSISTPSNSTWHITVYGWHNVCSWVSFYKHHIRHPSVSSSKRLTSTVGAWVVDNRSGHCTTRDEPCTPCNDNTRMCVMRRLHLCYCDNNKTLIPKYIWNTLCSKSPWLVRYVRYRFDNI